MRKLWTVIRQEYLNKVRTRAFLLGTFLTPLLMAGLMITPAYVMNVNVGKPTTLVVVDESGRLFDRLEAALTDTTKSGERLYHLQAERSDGRDLATLKQELGARVASGQIGGFFLVPADVIDGADVSFFAENVSDFRKMERLGNAVESCVREVRISRTNLGEVTIREILKDVKFETYKVGESGQATRDSGATFALAYAVGFIFYGTLIFFGVSMLRAALEEKTSRSAEVMVATVRPTTLMAGKIVGLGLVGLTQLAIWAAVVLFFSNTFGARFGSAGTEILTQVGITPTLLICFVIYFTLGFLFYSALFGAAGAMISSDLEAQQVQMPLMMPIILALMIMFMGIRDPNHPLVVTCSMIPFFAPIVMMVRVAVLVPPLWQIGLSIAIMLLSIWGVLLVAGRIFRVGLLMYGKRPDLPELIKWIRYG